MPPAGARRARAASLWDVDGPHPAELQALEEELRALVETDADPMDPLAGLHPKDLEV